MANQHPGEISVRDRGYLPHWEQRGAAYFVTFRLADALPQAVTERVKANQQALEAWHAQLAGGLTPAQQDRINRTSMRRIQTALDTGCGACLLARPGVANLVAGALSHFDGTRYRLICWCIMPNHVHVVFQPLGDCQLAKIIHSWKSFTANQANQLLGRNGDFWQREYYDHVVRDEADLVRIVGYVMDNPAKAKLTDWPWACLCPTHQWTEE